MLALLLAAGLASAQEAPDSVRALPTAPLEERLLKEIFGELSRAARGVRMESELPTAASLDGPPLFEGPVSLSYAPDWPNVCHACGSGLAAGDSFATASHCGGEDSGAGVVAVGNGIWSAAGTQGRNDPDKLAFVLSHELGHIRLKHRHQMEARFLALWGPWLAGPGRSLRERLGRGAPGPLSARDERELLAAFYQARARELTAFSRLMEDEADRYAAELSEAAGYDPEAGAAFFHQVLEASFLGTWVQTPPEPACGEPELFPPDAGETHDPPELRAWRLFERTFLRRLP